MATIHSLVSLNDVSFCTKILTMFPVVKNTFPELADVAAIYKSILFIYFIITINYLSYNLLLYNKYLLVEYFFPQVLHHSCNNNKL